MKKTIKVFMVIIMMLFITTGCNKLETYDEITYSELSEKLKKKDDFILLIGSESCSACAAYKYGLNKVIENYQIDIKYIDLDKVSGEELADIKELAYFSGTPATVFIKDGKEDESKKRINGNVKYSKIVKTLEENGYIKEK